VALAELPGDFVGNGGGVAAAVAADRLNRAWATGWTSATAHRQGHAIGGGGGGVRHWAPQLSGDGQDFSADGVGLGSGARVHKTKPLRRHLICKGAEGGGKPSAFIGI
jgi:hypothetical protein